jgi:putative salt-induced outer membrane protein YdiY
MIWLRVRRGAAFALVTLLSAADAHARDKTDVITFANGDKITCEVKKLDRGLLEVSTDNMGTLQIEWDKVVSITAPFFFEVETVDGMRRYGTLASAGPGQVAVVDAGQRAVLDVPFVIRMTPLKMRFWDRLDGSVGAGGSYTQSSGIGQLYVNGAVQARRPAFEWEASFDSTLTVEEDAENSSRYASQIQYDRFLRDRWFVAGFGRFEGNEDLGYTLRSTGGAGLGREVAHTNRTILSMTAGASFNRERPVSGDSVVNVEAFYAAGYSFFTYDYPKTNLSIGQMVFPSLSDVGRIRLNTSAKVNREIFKDFMFTLTLYDDYDNRPPTEEARKNDVGFSFSLGWIF